jgi:hypothetical protein
VDEPGDALPGGFEVGQWDEMVGIVGHGGEYASVVARPSRRAIGSVDDPFACLRK